MKKIYLVLIGLLVLFPGVVSAAINRPYSQNYHDECVENGTCVLLCGYTHKARITADIVEKAGYDVSSLYIYYHFDGNWQVSWIGTGSANTAFNNKWGNITAHQDDVFFQSSIISNLTNTGVCPKYGYVDQSGIGLSSEACFDSDGNYCIEKDPGGAGTDFKNKASESSLEYNYTDHIATHFNDWSFNDVVKMTCDEVLKSENAEKAVLEQVGSFEDFLFGNDMPTFMKNNPTYKNKLELAKEKYTERVKICKEQKINEINDNPDLTEEEKAEKISEVEQNAGEVTDTINTTNDRIENIKENGYIGNDFMGIGGEEIKVNLNIQQGCGLFSTSIRKWLLQALDIIKIAGLVLALVLSMFDFLKGAASGEADAMKKVWKSFSKRLITVVLLFLLPVLIEFILGLISINGVDASNPLCGIK